MSSRSTPWDALVVLSGCRDHRPPTSDLLMRCGLDDLIMTLYRYADNPEELFDAVVDHIVDELDTDPHIERGMTDNDWRTSLSDLARGSDGMPAPTRTRSRWSPPAHQPTPDPSAPPAPPKTAKKSPMPTPATTCPQSTHRNTRSSTNYAKA